MQTEESYHENDPEASDSTTLYGIGMKDMDEPQRIVSKPTSNPIQLIEHLLKPVRNGTKMLDGGTTLSFIRIPG